MKDGDLEGNQWTLTEHVPTGWDSDYDCLDSHIHFKFQTQYLTGGSRFDLSEFALTDHQWRLASKMSTVLEVCAIPTILFYAYTNCVLVSPNRFLRTRQSISLLLKCH